MEDDGTNGGDNGNSFRKFRELAWRVVNIEDKYRKIAYIRNYLRNDFKGDVASWIKLFICSVVPTRENLDLLRPERMPNYFSQIFGIEETKIVEKLDEVDDVGQVIRHFFTESRNVKPLKKSSITVQQVLTFLERISMTSAQSDVAEMIASIVPLCNPNDLKVVVRLLTVTLNLNMSEEDVLNVIHPQAFDFHMLNGVEATLNEYWTHSSSSSGNEDVTTTSEERKARKLRMQEEDDEELADLVKENTSFSTSSCSENDNEDDNVTAKAGHSRQDDEGESSTDEVSPSPRKKSKLSKSSQLPAKVTEDDVEKVINELLHPSTATGRGGLFYLPTDQDSERSESHTTRPVSAGDKRKSSETTPAYDPEEDPCSPTKIVKIDETMSSLPSTSRKSLFDSPADRDSSDERSTIQPTSEYSEKTSSDSSPPPSEEDNERVHEKQSSSDSSAPPSEEVDRAHEQSSSDSPPSPSEEDNEPVREKQSSSGSSAPPSEEVDRAHEQSSSDSPPSPSEEDNEPVREKQSSSGSSAPPSEEVDRAHEQSSSDSPPPPSEEDNEPVHEKQSSSGSSAPPLEEIDRAHEQQSGSDSSPALSGEDNEPAREKQSSSGSSPPPSEEIDMAHEQQSGSDSSPALSGEDNEPAREKQSSSGSSPPPSEEIDMAHEQQSGSDSSPALSGEDNEPAREKQSSSGSSPPPSEEIDMAHEQQSGSDSSPALSGEDNEPAHEKQSSSGSSPPPLEEMEPAHEQQSSSDSSPALSEEDNEPAHEKQSSSASSPPPLEEIEPANAQVQNEARISDPTSERNEPPTREVEEQFSSESSPPPLEQIDPVDAQFRVSEFVSKLNIPPVSLSEESSDEDPLHISDEMEPADAQNQDDPKIPSPNREGSIPPTSEDSERTSQEMDSAHVQDQQETGILDPSSNAARGDGSSQTTQDIPGVPGPSQRRTDSPSSSSLPTSHKWSADRSRKFPDHLSLTLGLLKNHLLSPEDVGPLSDEVGDRSPGLEQDDPDPGQMFRGCTLYPEEYADINHADLLESFVKLGGEVLDAARSSEATHVLHLFDAALEELPGCSFSARHVISEWLKDSIEAGRLVDIRRYMVRLAPNEWLNTDQGDNPEDRESDEGSQQGEEDRQSGRRPDEREGLDFACLL